MSTKEAVAVAQQEALVRYRDALRECRDSLCRLIGLSVVEAFVNEGLEQDEKSEIEDRALAGGLRTAHEMWGRALRGVVNDLRHALMEDDEF